VVLTSFIHNKKRFSR